MKKYKVIHFHKIEEIEHFVYLLNHYDDVDVDVKYGKYVVDGKSYLGVLALGLCKDLILEFNETNEELMNILKDKYNVKDFNL